MKRTISILICLMLVLSMAVPVFAAGESALAAHMHYISIDNNREGYVYEAYQIFSGDVDSTGVLSNIAWGSAIPDEKIEAMMTELKKLDAFKDCTDADTVAAVLAGLKISMDDPVAIAFADVVSQFATVSSGSSTFDTNTGKHTIYNLEDGYYLVKNTTVPEGANTTYTRYMLKVVADVNIAHKGDFPRVEKVIVEGEKELDTSEGFIGEVVNYKIEGTLPNNIDVYDTYYYLFRDTLSKGLTYNNDAKVYIVNVVDEKEVKVDVTDYFYKNSSANAGTGDKYEGGTSIVVGIQDLLALELLETPAVGTITSATKVVLTYSATLNENAVVGGYEGNPNKVRLEYDNDPNNDGDGTTTPPPVNPPEPTPPTVIGKTPEDEVTTYTTQLTIQKVDGAGKALAGAEFTLTSDANVKMTVVTKYTFTEDVDGEYWKLNDGTYTKTAPVEDDPSTEDVIEDTTGSYASTTTKYSVTPVVTVTPVDPAAAYNVAAEVDENGLVSFTGLGAGTYTLTETKTPAGFNTMDPITFTIEFAYDAAQERYEFFTSDRRISLDVNNSLFAEIENVAGSTLPSTGGMGTTLFYAFGSVLFVGAAVLLVTKKRMSA